METENVDLGSGPGARPPSLGASARQGGPGAENVTQDKGAGREAENLIGGSPSPLPSPPGEGDRPGARKIGHRRTVRRGRCDSILRRLPPEQRAKVDGWLFDDQLTYAEVAERCRQELGVQLDTASVGRYCRQEQARRPKPADEPLPVADSGNSYITLLETMSEKALRAVWKLELESDPKAIAEFARVLVAARQEANQALRASTTREKFEFDAATACLIHQVKVSSIAADESLDDGERILKIREELFGPNLPM